jgi:hypothetical protein
MRNLHISLHHAEFKYLFATRVAEEAIKDGVSAENKNLCCKFHACFSYVYKLALI